MQIWRARSFFVYLGLLDCSARVVRHWQLDCLYSARAISTAMVNQGVCCVSVGEEVGHKGKYH